MESDGSLGRVGGYQVVDRFVFRFKMSFLFLPVGEEKQNLNCVQGLVLLATSNPDRSAILCDFLSKRYK
jgi:hypothetical protein